VLQGQALFRCVLALEAQELLALQRTQEGERALQEALTEVVV